MFVRYFVGLPLPLTAVEAALTRSPEAWVPALARAADAHGQRLLAEVRFRLGGEGPRIAKRVGIELGQLVRSPARDLAVARVAGYGTPGPVPRPRQRTRDRAARGAPGAGSAPNASFRSARFGRVVDRALPPGGRDHGQGLCRSPERRPDTARGAVRPIRVMAFPLRLVTQPRHRQLAAGG